ncbi:MAG: thioesterase [Eubacteriales bacterium]|nr:thioesterase [Eubacteriales bacterium]
MDFSLQEKHNRIEEVLREAKCDYKLELFPHQLLVAANEVAAVNMDRSPTICNANLRAGGLAWMISGYSFVFRGQRAHKGEKLISETWADEIKAVRFRRKHLFFRQNTDLDRVFACAASDWFIADQESRRPMRPFDLLNPDEPEIWQGCCPELTEFRVKRLPAWLDENTDNESKYFFRDFQADYSDLDCNNHLNNTRYLAFSLDALFSFLAKEQIEILHKLQIKEIHLNFVAEVLPLETVRIFLRPQTQIEDQEVSFTYQGESVSFNEKSTFLAYDLEGYNLTRNQAAFRAQIMLADGE